MGETYDALTRAEGRGRRAPQPVGFARATGAPASTPRSNPSSPLADASGDRPLSRWSLWRVRAEPGVRPRPPAATDGAVVPAAMADQMQRIESRLEALDASMRHQLRGVDGQQLERIETRIARLHLSLTTARRDTLAIERELVSMERRVAVLIALLAVAVLAALLR